MAPTQDKRTELKNMLDQCTRAQRTIFKGQYSPTDPFAELKDIVDNMGVHQLNAALTSVKRHLHEA